MYIERVVLSRIKGFEKLDLDFRGAGAHAGWCVVTGNNGSGKTALLRALSMAILGPEHARTLVPDLRGWVADGSESGTISVELKPHHDYDTTARGGHPLKGSFWAEAEVSLDRATGTVAAADVFRKKRKSALNGPWSNNTQGWLAVAYGPFRRLYGNSPEAARLALLPGRIPRFATLFKEDATLDEGEKWLQDLQYKRLEEEARDRLPFSKQPLEQLIALVSDNYLHDGVTISEVTADGIWLCDVAKRKIRLADMSEGYRSALAMLIDIFRHMVNVYGPEILSGSPDGRYYCVDRPGVVLIDEIDAHIHPRWQREIGFWLRHHFPNVQFIVTTHSPLVCAAADEGRVYHLPQPGDGEPFRLSKDDYDRVIAGKPDEILLTPAFGLTHTRSPRAVAARERHAVLISRQLSLGELADDEAAELKQLELFIEDRP